MALAEYFSYDDSILEYAQDADNDPDVVSVEYLSPSPPSLRGVPIAEDEIDGALVFIKGKEHVLAFMAWAKSIGILNDHPWKREDMPETSSLSKN